MDKHYDIYLRLINGNPYLHIEEAYTERLMYLCKISHASFAALATLGIKDFQPKEKQA